MMQSDIRHSGFSKIFKAFDDDESKQNGVFCTSIGVEDIKRSEILKFIVSKLVKEI